MPDKKHARLALQMINRGDLTPEEKQKVRDRANKMLKVKSKEADRGTDGKLKPGNHTTQAREHILAASIALTSGDMEEAGRRIDSARIHASHSQHKDAQSAIEDLNGAGEKSKAQLPHEAAKLLDSAYGKLQGEANLLLKAKSKPNEVKESLGGIMSSSGRLRETLTAKARFIEGSYRPDKREVDVIIIDEGLGNKRDSHYYYADTIKRAVAERVFEAAQCYADHPGKDDDINRPERSVRDLVGYFKNSRVLEVNGKVAYAATLRVQRGADWALGLIQEAIDYNKEFPNNVYIGISINADGDIKPDEQDGAKVNGVTRITEAFSADIVTKPGRGGKVLALVESASGTSHNKESGMKFKSLQEAAAFLEKLADGESVDPADLKEAAKYIREAKTKEEGGADGDADDAAAKKAAKEAADKEAADKTAKEAADKAAKEAAGKDPEDKGDGGADEDTEDKNGKKTTESNGSGGGNLRETHATLFASALQEAQKMVGNDLAKLQRENAELKAEKDLRESIELATQKLKESAVPERAFEAVMTDMIGRTPAEMDRIIEAEISRAEAYGFKPGKQTAGNGQRQSIDLRESDVRSNTSALLADVVEA